MCNCICFCVHLYLCICWSIWRAPLGWWWAQLRPQDSVRHSSRALSFPRYSAITSPLTPLDSRDALFDSLGPTWRPPWSLWTPKTPPLTPWAIIDVPLGPPSVPYDPLWPPRRPPFLKAYHLDIWIKIKYQLEDLPRPFGLVSPDPRMLFLYSGPPLCTGQRSEGWQQVRVFFNPKRARTEPLESFTLKSNLVDPNQ